MSILIKGVKMPKHDGEILCIDIHPDGTVCMNMDLKCRKIAEAKELPPHGRLIDADALIDMMPTIGDEYLYARETIEEAPTVIEAEKGEE